MTSEEEERLMFPSFLFPEIFPADAATPDSGKSIRLPIDSYRSMCRCKLENNVLLIVAWI
jgi:hypothetical protein